MTATPAMSREDRARRDAQFIVPEDMGTPAGALTLRGATNFQTPPGWDTVYTPIFNMIERPVAPMLVVRVETDWYMHETEFRYVLQPGEGISGSHTMPIGQVMFVPREEISSATAARRSWTRSRSRRRQFSRDKAAARVIDALRHALQPALSEAEPRPEAEGLAHFRVGVRGLGRSQALRPSQSVDTFFQFLTRCSAVRQASACAVSVGLCAPLVPITDAPSTPRFGTSCEKPQRLTTLVSGLSPMRVPP